MGLGGEGEHVMHLTGGCLSPQKGMDAP